MGRGEACRQSIIPLVSSSANPEYFIGREKVEKEEEEEEEEEGLCGGEIVEIVGASAAKGQEGTGQNDGEERDAEEGRGVALLIDGSN